jgi:protein involved in polysaccharide export with SLBB domain
MTSRNAKNLERGIRNHSELGVRNGSELSGLVAANHDDDRSSSRAGRPPVLNDRALDDLVVLMHRKSGRLPRLDELIAEAGGCQRQRASKALQRARSGEAERELMDVLRLPAELEQLQRRWIEQWMQAAAGQLADRHADLVAKHDEQIEALEALISEQHRALTSLRDQRADLERMTDELLKARDDDRLQIERLAAERDIAERLARGRN